MKIFRSRRSGGLLIALLALGVAGCGSEDDAKPDDGVPVEPSPPSQARGQLLQNPPPLIETVSTADLLTHLDDPVGQALLLQAGRPLCDIAVHKLEYTTVGAADEETTASGALMLPTGAGGSCRGARPVLVYAHGTTTESDFDIADLNDSENAEGLYLATFFAAQGYIVVAPNYAGYDSSKLAYHPYLVADQQSKDMIDALTAARRALPAASAPETTAGGKLYVAGYSQGGYVAMATHRAMEAAGMSVTASAPMSGPYALTAFVDAVFAGRVSGSAPAYLAFLITAYQEAYGNVYTSPSELFAPKYADDIESLLPSTKSRGQLYADGELPQSAVFDVSPPDPAYLDITPATTPSDLAPVFARGFGTDHLITNSYRLRYLQDAQANPDGAWPVVTNGAPPANPGLPLRQALKRNDLRNWTPVAPTLLCGGRQDPTVFWLNSEAMQAYWSANAPSAPYTVLNVDGASSGSNDPFEDIKQGFAVAKDLVAASAVARGATDGGTEAVLELYHAGLVAPFCLEAAKDFFEEH